MAQCPSCGSRIGYPRMLLAQYGIECPSCQIKLSSRIKDPMWCFGLIAITVVAVWIASYYVPILDNELYIVLCVLPVWFLVPFLIELHESS